MNKEQFTGLLEKQVLARIDEIMNGFVHGSEHPEPYQIAGLTIRPISAGWKDGDLPQLLTAIRAQADVLWERFDLTRKFHE